MPEDELSCLPGETFTLTTAISGPGTVLQTPDLANYSCGEQVSLTATPDAGTIFESWSGALTGSENPTTVTVVNDTTITANFSVLDPQAPTISNIAITAGANSATITWDTDEPATSSVEYGVTSSYELGTQSTGALVTNHSLTLIGLNPDTVYHYQMDQRMV
ncbi:MAG: hypothetical protein R3F53_13240 [Gammaproteobacteria bacterium]